MNKKERYMILSGVYVICCAALIVATQIIASLIDNPEISYPLLTLLTSGVFLISGTQAIFVNSILCQTRAGAKGTYNNNDYHANPMQSLLLYSYILSLPANLWSPFLHFAEKTKIISLTYLWHILVFLIMAFALTMLAKFIKKNKDSFLRHFAKAAYISIILCSGLILNYFHSISV